jgi:hypothetical protein
MLIILVGCLVAEVAEVDVVEADTITHNTCKDYAPSWVDACPANSRCIEFRNSCAEPVSLAYNVGCNSDGTAGAPQCACTAGATLAPASNPLAANSSKYWVIVDGAFPADPPAWMPSCLTSGLAVLANAGTTPSCTTGTRVEFTAGNQSDVGGRFDSYNLDVEKDWYSVPVSFRPNLPNGCATDHGGHDCRPLWCDSSTCPDAYDTPTAGGCPTGWSPQAACQESFDQSFGYTVEYCPASGASCQDAVACPTTTR